MRPAAVLSRVLSCAALALSVVSAPALADPPRPSGRGGMAMKTVVCRAVEAAQGKAGAELASAVEQLANEMSRTGYAMTGLLAGDPPVACFRSLNDNSKLPIGAR